MKRQVLRAVLFGMMLLGSFSGPTHAQERQEAQTPLSGAVQSMDQPTPVSQQLEALPPTVLPPGTLGPVTLKSTLQKNQFLVLSLEDALKLAEGQNIQIRIDQEQLTQRRLDYKYRLSDLLPDFVAEYNQSRFVGAFQIFGGTPISIYRTTFQPQLSANYSIYTAGKNIFEIRASKQRQEAQQNQLEETRQNTLRNVALAYYDLQQGYWSRAIALQSIREAEAQVALNKARYESGVGVKLDYLQAQTALSTQRQALINAENQISKQVQRLALLLNLDFDVDITPPSIESTVTQLAPQDMTAKTLLDVARLHHPRLKTLKLLKEAAGTDVKVAIADIFPRIDVAAYINGTGPGLDELGLSRFIGVRVSTNLLDNMGLGKPLQIKSARSNFRLADLMVTQAERILEESLATNLLDLKTLEERIVLDRQTLAYANETYSQAFGRLKEGVGTNIDVENAMTRLTEARTTLAGAFLDYNKTQIALLSNLGVISVNTLTQGASAYGNLLP